MSKETLITCDDCEKEINYENMFEVFVKPKGEVMTKYCRHELCDDCWKKFKDYIAGFKE